MAIVKPWINYHHLLYFKTIAELGSVSKAAEKLRLGQPTLSAQVKKLEETLEVQLFERKHKKLILTEQGKLALEYAKNIFSLGDEMFEVLHDRLVPAKTHLQIGALDSIPKQLLVQLSKAAYKIAKCSIAVVEGKLDEILRELTSHRVDILVSNYVPQGLETKGLSHRLISKKDVHIYGSQKFKPVRKDFPNSLIGQPFILPTFDSRLRYDLDHWFKTKNINVDIIAEMQDISLKKLMAVEGMGMIPSGSQTVMRQVLKGDLIEIGRLNNLHEEIFLLTANRKKMNPIAAELMSKFSL
jgi:LysR family transcriptional regulator, transcriptional activator of nhaA